MNKSMRSSFHKSSDCKTLQQNYKILSKLGQGAFGACWKIQHRQTNQIYACKIINNEFSIQVECLLQEIKILSTIKGIQGFPEIKAYGNDKKSTFILMDVLGRDLESIKKQFKNFSIQMGMHFAVQMIQRIQDLHEAGFIHRDIKPENFLVGENDENYLYLIDFGLGKSYLINGLHEPFKQGKQIVGTTRYSSINSLKAFEQSRRDDLEAIGYVLVYLCLGKLPWQDVKAKEPAEFHAQILKKKEEISPYELTRQLPRQFQDYLTYVKKLQFNETPDYGYLKSMFRQNSQILCIKETLCLTNDSIKKSGKQNDNTKNRVSLVINSCNNSPEMKSPSNNSYQKNMVSLVLNSCNNSPERKSPSINSCQKNMMSFVLNSCKNSDLKNGNFNSWQTNSSKSSEIQSIDIEEFPNKEVKQVPKDQVSENILDTFLSERKVNIEFLSITKRSVR